MATEMKWTLETYRLDEVARKFDFPCVVCVNEGFYSATESEGFSQGDIMSIDTRMMLHKVAANFAEDTDFTMNADDDGYIELTSETEIFVPLNYKGKLKVLTRTKNFNSVRELAIDFPRYAKLRQNLEVITEDKKKITIAAGSVIELDRTIPGSSGSGQTKLVVQFCHMGKNTVVALPMNLKGKFITEPDDMKYTIKEAIDRYSLPQHVRFVDDEIKRVYTQDLLDGIENMKTITATLRLNRLVTQEVLVGHFKPVEGTENTDSERFKQRTLVVLPIDDPEIRDIEVNVLLGVTEDIYSDVFLVRNVSTTEEIVDGSLYIDFVMSPGIKRIRNDLNDDNFQEKDGTTDSVTSSVSASGLTPTQTYESEVAPPIPPRRAKPAPKLGNSGVQLLVKPKHKKTVEPEPVDGTEDYETMSSPTSPSAAIESGLGFTLADLSFEDTTGVGALKKSTVTQLNEKKNAIKTTLGNIFQKKIVAKVKPKKAGYKSFQATNNTPQEDEIEEGQAVYDEVDEQNMDYMAKSRVVGYDTPPHPRPVARVLPTVCQKRFSELTIHELVERLKNGKLASMAEFCEKERLNGSFFKHMSKEDIQKTFSLSGVDLMKFVQMMDKNWIPPI